MALFRLKYDVCINLVSEIKNRRSLAKAQHPFLQALIHHFSTSRVGLFPENTEIEIFVCRS
jgi:hypothetical protein